MLCLIASSFLFGPSSEEQLSKYWRQDVGSLGEICLALEKSSKMSYKVAVYLFYWQWCIVPIVPHTPSISSVFFFFLSSAVLIVVQCYLIVLICKSLMIYDVEYIFVCLFTIYFGQVSIQILPISNGVVCSIVLDIMSTNPLSDKCFANLFLSVCGLSWDLGLHLSLNFQI